MVNNSIEKIYLDVCVLCRPYDDQSAMRIRLETDAVFLILEAIRRGDYKFIRSPVHYKEVEDIEDNMERSEILSFLDVWGTEIGRSIQAVRARAEEFYSLGLGAADAAHLAFAEAGSDCLVSCDDRFVKRASRICPTFPVLGPVEFCAKEELK